MTRVYIAGDMLTKGSQLLRAQEKADIEALGLKLYNPMDNKDINDKANLDNNAGLAERIVVADTKALMHSDVVVIEPQPFALGTCVELGQLLGYKQLAESIMGIIDRMDFEGVPPEAILCAVAKSLDRHYNREVFAHYEDIRRFPGVVEEGDRRSLGVNQYVYGAVLALTEGQGFMEWSNILDTLKTKEVK